MELGCWEFGAFLQFHKQPKQTRNGSSQSRELQDCKPLSALTSTASGGEITTNTNMMVKQRCQGQLGWMISMQHLSLTRRCLWLNAIHRYSTRVPHFVWIKAVDLQLHKVSLKYWNYDACSKWKDKVNAKAGTEKTQQYLEQPLTNALIEGPQFTHFVLQSNLLYVTNDLSVAWKAFQISPTSLHSNLFPEILTQPRHISLLWLVCRYESTICYQIVYFCLKCFQKHILTHLRLEPKFWISVSGYLKKS